MEYIDNHPYNIEYFMLAIIIVTLALCGCEDKTNCKPQNLHNISNSLDRIANSLEKFVDMEREPFDD